MTETIVPETKTGDEVKVPSQDISRTPEEIAAYNLQKKAEDAKALGLDPKKILGVESSTEVPEWYKQEKAKETKKTSLQFTEAILDADLKEKVVANLARIVPSDNPEEDFKLALGAASSSKNKQVIDEMKRYSPARVVATGGSTPAPIEEEFVLRPDEEAFTKPPYNLSKEKIIAARKATEAKG